MTRLRKTLNVSDDLKLQQLLVNTNACEGLNNLYDMAMKASKPYRSGQTYIKATKAFCDGFEVKLGEVGKVKAAEMKAILQNSI